MNGRNARPVLTWRRYQWLFLGMALLSQCGCLAVAAGTACGVAATAYYQGNKKEVFSADFETVWAATHEALFDLELPIRKETKDLASGTIESLTGQKDSVTIEIVHEPGKLRNDPAYTRVKIRVGTWGDQAASNRIFDRIDYWVQRYQTAGRPPAAQLP